MMKEEGGYGEVGGGVVMHRREEEWKFWEDDIRGIFVLSYAILLIWWRGSH